MKAGILNALNTLVLVLLAGLLIWQVTRFGDLDVRLSALDVASQQQTAVIHRALGKIIPIELPESLEGSLSSLEQRIQDQKAWPQDRAEAERLQKDLDVLVGQIPVWAEEDLLPRLNVLRWSVPSVYLITRAKDANDAYPDDLADAMNTALDVAPAGAPDALVAALAEARDSQAKQLTDLQKSRLTAERQEFLASASGRLNKALEEKDAFVRQVLLGEILKDVVTQRLSLVDEPEADAAIGDQLSVLMGRLRTEAEADSTVREQKWRDYQKWALEQVRSFNGEYVAAMGGLTDKVNGARIRDAMVKYLVPISTESLDTAVSRLYGEAFDKGWKKLEGRKDTNDVDLQFYVATQEAVVQKHKL